MLERSAEPCLPAGRSLELRARVSFIFLSADDADFRGLLFLVVLGFCCSPAGFLSYSWLLCVAFLKSSDLIPGRQSLRSFTLGYNSLTPTGFVNTLLSNDYLLTTYHLPLITPFSSSPARQLSNSLRTPPSALRPWLLAVS